MYKVSVPEKVFGQLVVNTYSFPKKEQMILFKQMCEEDGDIVIVHGKPKRVQAVV